VNHVREDETVVGDPMRNNRFAFCAVVVRQLDVSSETIQAADGRELHLLEVNVPPTNGIKRLVDGFLRREQQSKTFKLITGIPDPLQFAISAYQTGNLDVSHAIYSLQVDADREPI
jgi:hypothetical protein